MQEASKKPKQNRVKTVLQLLISVFGLIFIFYKIPFSEVYNNWNIRMIPWVIAMCIAATLTMVIQANRWKGLSVQGPQISFKTYYAYTALGYFFNNILPTGFGGDAVKSIAFGKRFNQTSQSVSAVFISRIQGLLAMFLCFFATLPIALTQVDIPLQYTLIMSGALLICIAIIIASLFSDKIPLPQKITDKISFLPKLQTSLSIYRNYRKQLLFSSLDSLWIQILTLFIAYAFFRAVGININIGILVAFTSITAVITMLPISLNGIGIREGVQVALYTGLLGIPASTVLSAGLLGYLPLLFQAAQGAVVLASLKGKNFSKENSDE